ncbi:DedA family protein [Microbacterium arabinogalactanolyticum]|uniref:DedA family protein n=1 Tax=Microbacterium arabinogalactanolyticum TaxID=69365 RepID=UPI0040449EE5
MDIINDLILQAVASPWIALILFAVAAIDGFFPPVPSETVLVAAAAVAGTTGSTSVLVLCAAGALGAMVGDNIAYGIGRAVGTDRFRWMRRPRVASSFDLARRTLSQGGAGLILGARYIPVGRVAVNMTAGALGYPWPRFLLLSAVGGALWAAYSVAIGLLAGQWLKGQPLLSAVIGVVAALAIGIVVDRVAARRRRRTGEPPIPQNADAVAERCAPVMGG